MVSRYTDAVELKSFIMTINRYTDSTAIASALTSLSDRFSNMELKTIQKAADSAPTAYIPEGSDVIAGDRILFDGDTYEINGEPKKWTGAFTRSHIQLNLTRWEG